MEQLAHEYLPHPTWSPDPLPTNYYVFEHLKNFLVFFRDSTSTTAEEFVKFQSMDVYATGIKQIFFLDNNVDCSGSCFDR